MARVELPNRKLKLVSSREAPEIGTSSRIVLPHRKPIPSEPRVYSMSSPVHIKDGGTYFPEIPDGLPRYIDVPNSGYVWDYQQAEWRKTASVPEDEVGDWPPEYTDLIIIDGTPLTDIIAGIEPPAPYDPLKVHLNMHWRGPWVQEPYNQPYHAGDVVVDGAFQMIANKETESHAAPIQNDDVAYTLPDTPAWQYGSYTGVIQSGVQFHTNQPVNGVSYEVWAPTLTDDTNYVIRLFTYPEGRPESVVYRQVPEGVLTENDWTVVEYTQSIIGSNMVFGIIIDALNSGADTIVAGGWNRSANNNEVSVDPGLQGWGTRNTNEQLRLSYTDLDDVDRRTELLGILPGTRVEVANSTNATQNMTWTVGSAGTDYGTHIGFENVTYEGQGSNGPVPIGVNSTFTISIPTPSPTDYVWIDGGVPIVPWGTAEGILRLDGLDQPGMEGHAFGVRLQAGTYTQSPDWDILSLSDLSSGGGSTNIIPEFGVQAISGGFRITEG